MPSDAGPIWLCLSPNSERPEGLLPFHFVSRFRVTAGLSSPWLDVGQWLYAISFPPPLLFPLSSNFALDLVLQS